LSGESLSPKRRILVKNDKKDFENPYLKKDWAFELENGLINGFEMIINFVPELFESLVDKTVDALNELDRISMEKDRFAKETDTGTILFAYPSILEKGDVIFARRIVYRHYGIYAGKNMVIHYAGKENPVRPKITVEETTLDEFSKGDPVYVIQFPKKADFLYSPGKTLKRAKSCIGRTDYNLVSNNCEHFAYWCKTGRHESSQVKDVCERLFNKRFELDELKDEITGKALDAAGVVFEKIGDTIGYVVVCLLKCLQNLA
jgi:hypothetical protein